MLGDEPLQRLCNALQRSEGFRVPPDTPPLGADGAPGEGKPVAGALNLIGSHALFGRNWGCLFGDKVPNLHFEVSRGWMDAGHAGHAGLAGR